jgi:hypothetical protein
MQRSIGDVVLYVNEKLATRCGGLNSVYRETPIAKAQRIGIGKLNNPAMRRE